MSHRCYYGGHCLASFLCYQCQQPVCRMHSEECCDQRFCDSCVKEHRTSIQSKEDVHAEESEIRIAELNETL